MSLLRPVLLLAVSVLAAGALGACGDDDESSAQTPVIDIRLAFGGPGGDVVRTLTCDPVGGTWPASQEACAGLTARPELLAPIEIETRDLVTITPVPLRITGTAFGDPVALEFPERGSGTRLARLRALREALGPEAYDAVAAEARPGG